jgi:hypothetical protein
MDFSKTRLSDMHPMDDHLTTRRFFRTEQDAKKGALSGTTGTSDEGKFPWKDLQGDVRKGGNLTGVSLKNMIHLNRRFIHH